MRYIILKEKDLQELDISIFEKYGGAILYEDGSLYPYDTYSFPSPVCDHPGLLEDYQYYVSHGYVLID